MFFNRNRDLENLVVPYENNEAWAIQKVRDLFAHGLSNEDWNKARRKVFTRLANKGDAYAMYMLGILSENSFESKRWLEAAANHGSTEAMKSLGLKYLDLGDDFNTPDPAFQPNNELSKYWYKRAAECGDADAMTSYASFHCDDNFDEKCHYYEMAAKAGYWKGYKGLADAYEGLLFGSDGSKTEYVLNLYLQAAHLCTDHHDSDTYASIAHSIGHLYGALFLLDTAPKESVVKVYGKVKNPIEAMRWYTYADVCGFDSQENIFKISQNSGVHFDNNDYQRYRQEVINHFGV